MKRQVGVVIRKHQFAVAVHQHQDGIMDVGGNHARPDIAKLCGQRVEPCRKKTKRDGMARCNLQPDTGHSLFRTNDGPGVEQAVENVVGSFPEKTSSGCQCGRVTAAVDQVRSHPLFERLNPPAETGLCDVANLSGSRETLVLGKSNKVLDPFDLHTAPFGLLKEKRVCACRVSLLAM